MENVEYLGFLIEVTSPESGTYEYSVFDMTGKDKPEFPLFETDNMGFASDEVAVEDAKVWIRDFLIEDDDRAAEHIEKLYATKKALISSLSAETAGRVLQKLTVDVFNRPDCPAWANYAAVASGGNAIYFSNKPYPADIAGVWHGAERWDFAKLKCDATDWQNSLIERPKLQKLTTEVFNRPDCPDWADYAVVNSRGTLIFFGNKPCFEGEDYGCWSCSDYKYKHIKDAVFDATDWPNSLIERTAKLPDWCKVGEWVYNKGEDIYGVVMSIDLPYIEVKYDGRDIVVNTISAIVQARIRPYNKVEMRTLVGKVIDFEENSDLVISYDGESGEVYADDVWFSGEELLNNGYMYLGKPCGIPVHLNEKGEWVE